MVKGKEKPNSNEKNDTTTNFLLDSTDSDVEWGDLPPLKGKKPRRKKTKQAAIKTKRCSLKVVFTVFFMILLVGAILLLSVVSVWLTSQLNEVKEKLKSIEGESMSSSAVVHQLIQQLSVVSMITAQQNNSFSQQQSSISSLNDTLIKLSAIVDTLSHGLEAAPELKDLPGKLVVFSKTLAVLGSNVSGLKDTVDLLSPSMKSAHTKLEELSKKFADLNQNAGASASSPQMSPDVANIVQRLTEQIQGINSTVSSQLSVLMKNATIDGEKLFELESKSQNLSEILESVSSAQKLLNAVLNADAAMPDDYTSEKFESRVKDIVENMTITPVGIEGAVTIEMLKHLEDGLTLKVQNLNTSLVQLKSTVAHMTDLLVKQATKITNMTKQIEATQYYVFLIESKLDKTTGDIAYSTTNTPTLDFVVPNGTSMSGTLTTAASTEIVQSSVSKKTIVIPSIKNITDLDINFHRWNFGSDGDVKFDVLPNFLGPYTPNEEDLKLFDEDYNGQYSLQEFAKALGLSVGTETQTSAPSRR